MTTATDTFKHHKMRIPGTNELLWMPTRDSLRGSDDYAWSMAWVRSHLEGVDPKDRLQAVTENLDMMVTFVLYNAAGESDMIAYIQNNVPPLLGHAWLLDDYCARELGVEGVFNGYKYEIYTDGGIEFVWAVTRQLIMSYRLQEQTNAEAENASTDGSIAEINAQPVASNPAEHMDGASAAHVTAVDATESGLDDADAVSAQGKALANFVHDNLMAMLGAGATVTVERVDGSGPTTEIRFKPFPFDTPTDDRERKSKAKKKAKAKAAKRARKR